MMFNFIKDDKGLSLIWVIILIIVVGGLSAVLLSAATHNIRFSVDETDTSRAFYAAEAGVQKLMAYPSEDLEDYNDDEIDFIFSGNLSYRTGDYEVTYIVEHLSGNNFKSTGLINDRIEQIIEFSLDKDAISDLAALINKGDTDDIDDYINLRGAEKEFSKDNLALVDIGPWWEFLENNYWTIEGEAISGEEGDGPDNNEYLKKSIDENDDEYDAFEKFWNAKGKYGIYDGSPDFWEIKEMERIGDREVISGKRWYFTPYLVEAGDSVGSYEKWDRETRYTGNAKVYYYDEGEGKYRFFELINNLPNNPPNDDGSYPKPAEYEEYWQENEYTQDEIKKLISDDEEYQFDSNMVIENSILAIEGSLKLLGNITFRNSLIIVKNNVEFGGSFDLDESLIISFNEDGADEDTLVTTGNPSIGLDLVRRETYEKWPGIASILDDLGDEFFINAVVDWRQVK